MRGRVITNMLTGLAERHRATAPGAKYKYIHCCYIVIGLAFACSGKY